MIEVKNKKNPIAGYMGCLPTNEDRDDSNGPLIDSHIPGYVGYIPGVKSENLYAKTYGKITENCSKQNFPRGIELPPEIKYKSTTKETYVDPNRIKQEELEEGKISGVKMSTFSNAAKYLTVYPE